MPALSSNAIAKHLKQVPRWRKYAKSIKRTYAFSGFEDAITFVNAVAKQAQRANHHPDINIRFDKVTIQLSTHDEGGITEKDFALAATIDKSCPQD